MSVRFLAAILILVGVSVIPAWAEEPKQDSSPLSDAETATFLPLVCKQPPADHKPAKSDGEYHCEILIGYGELQPSEAEHLATDPATLSLQKILYGGMTQAGADEAYVSYTSDAEPHANNFGGGILFARAKGSWRLVQWFPGDAMYECLAIPGKGPRSMLCLEGYEGGGELDSSVWVRYLKKSGNTLSLEHESVAKAQDSRHEVDPGQPDAPPCAASGKAHKAMLLSIDDLKHATEPGDFAVSGIAYATAGDIAAACGRNHFEEVKTQTGSIRYAIRDGKVVSMAPLKFLDPDY